MMMMLIAIPIAIMAQIEPPADWGDVISNPTQWFVSFGALAVLTAFIAAFLNGLLKITKGFVKQLIAWAVGIILIIGSKLIGFGYAVELTFLAALMHGIGIGLAANGVFDVPIIKTLMSVIEGWFKSTKE